HHLVADSRRHVFGGRAMEDANRGSERGCGCVEELRPGAVLHPLASLALPLEAEIGTVVLVESDARLPKRSLRRAFDARVTEHRSPQKWVVAGHSKPRRNHRTD